MLLSDVTGVTNFERFHQPVLVSITINYSGKSQKLDKIGDLVLVKTTIGFVFF